MVISINRKISVSRYELLFPGFGDCGGWCAKALINGMLDVPPLIYDIVRADKSLGEKI